MILTPPPAVPLASNGTPILDALPRNEGGSIDIDVYLRDTRTGRAVVHRSPYGNLQRDPLPVGPDWREEEHDYFKPYWWAEGNFGCDCNRSTLGGADGTPLCDAEYPCGGHRAGVIVIDKITPAGMPDVVLYADADREG